MFNCSLVENDIFHKIVVYVLSFYMNDLTRMSYVFAPIVFKRLV